MEITPEDRASSNSTKSNTTAGKYIALVIALCLLAGLGYYLLQQPKPNEAQVTNIPAEELSPMSSAVAPPEITKQPEPTPAIEIPEQSTPMPVPDFVLPNLDNSDPEAKKYLDGLTAGKNLSSWFHPEYIIRRGTTFIDGLAQGLQLNKMLKIPTPKEKFLAIKEGNRYWVNSDNYPRYDYFINMLNAIEENKLIEAFHLFRPLLTEAYGELGYSGQGTDSQTKDSGTKASQTLDNAIISALDQILATPIINEPIELTRESVQYQYADPKLEALPPIQKQLLRMGPQHIQVIQNKARSLRQALLGQ